MKPDNSLKLSAISFDRETTLGITAYYKDGFVEAIAVAWHAWDDVRSDL